MGDSEISEPDPASAQPVDNRLFVLVLQHPQEGREALATAAITVGTLRRAGLVIGLSWPSLSRVLGRHADPKRWGVLYLGSAQPAALAPTRELTVLAQGGAAAAGSATILRSLEGIVLLDGTWKQAKTLWWRNPWLLKLHRLVLQPPLPARLGRLRREPRGDALSTLEAAALALRHLEAAPDAADALLAALDRLMATARQRRSLPGGRPGP